MLTGVYLQLLILHLLHVNWRIYTASILHLLHVTGVYLQLLILHLLHVNWRIFTASDLTSAPC